MKGVYVVRKRTVYGLEYLWLDGPYQYPKWTTSPSSATPLTGARAALWAGIVDADFVPVEKVADEGPQTKRTSDPPSGGYGYGGGY